MGDWLKLLGTWFTNVSMSAANADAPAVTAASGWNRNKDGSWDLSKVDDPGVELLRDNLSGISGMAFGAEVEPLVISGWNILKGGFNFLKNPVQSTTNIVKLIKPNLEYLKKYLSLLDSPRAKGTFTGKIQIFIKY